MKKYLSILKKLGIYLIILLGAALILSLLNIFGIKSSTTNIISIIFMSFLFLLLGFKQGKKAIKKGFLEGIKIGTILIISLIIINLIVFQSDFNLNRIIYYLILLLSSILGGCIGINKKKD